MFKKDLFSGNCDVPVVNDPPAPQNPDNSNITAPNCSDGIDNENDIC